MDNPWTKFEAGLVQAVLDHLALRFVTRTEYVKDKTMVAQVVSDIQAEVAKLKTDLATKLAAIAASTMDSDTAVALQGVLSDLQAMDAEVNPPAPAPAPTSSTGSTGTAPVNPS